MTNSYNRYLETYNGQQLLKKHTLDKSGTWKILGEDPNCDLGGHHHYPELCTFTGTLKEAILYATELPGFWLWGGGGKIEWVTADVGVIQCPYCTKIYTDPHADIKNNTSLQCGYCKNEYVVVISTQTHYSTKAMEQKLPKQCYYCKSKNIDIKYENENVDISCYECHSRTIHRKGNVK